MYIFRDRVTAFAPFHFGPYDNGDSLLLFF